MDTLKVKSEGPHKDADRVGLDGLPHVGAVVWPQQAYYGTVDRMTCKPCWCKARLAKKQKKENS